MSTARLRIPRAVAVAATAAAFSLPQGAAFAQSLTDVQQIYQRVNEVSPASRKSS